MTKMITELTKEQEQLMTTVRNEWISLCDSGKDITLEGIQEHIEWLYTTANLPVPKIILTDSPLETYKKIREISQTPVGPHNNKARVFSLWDFGWTAYYEYFERIGVDLKSPGWKKWLALAKSGIFNIMAYKKICFVSKMPIIVKRDPRNGNLHSTDGPSIKFRDGFEVYFLSGVRFDKELYNNVVGKKFTVRDILNMRNIEQRMAAINTYAPEEIFAAIEPTLLHSKDGYSLYSVEKLTSEVNYFLKYKCPSTDRDYISFVSPEVGEKKDAIAAIASKWGLTKNEWENINYHS